MAFLALTREEQPSHAAADVEAGERGPDGLVLSAPEASRYTTREDLELIEYPDDEINAIARLLDLSLEDAERRLRLEDAAIGWSYVWRDQLGDAYAGQWLAIDDVRLTLALSGFGGNVETLGEQLGSLFPYPENFEVVSVEHSWNELLDLQDRIVQDVTIIRSGAPKRDASPGVSAVASTIMEGVDIGVRPSMNAVEIFLPYSNGSDSFEKGVRAFSTVYEGSMVAYSEGTMKPRWCAPGDCRPDVFGGLQTVRNNQARCMTGFSVSAGFSSRGFLSAGHCGGLYRGLGSTI